MSKKVLVIDDEPAMLEVLKQHLKRDGYDPITASNGENGLQKVKTEQPDLIILDIMMPRLDGYTFVQKVKYNNAITPIPIIVLTGMEMFKSVFEFEGVKEYLLKPFKLKELSEKINKHIRH
ncbi:MAG: response regulator [PVC group bacterium]|nr:response regulator [PVC group bacterium]